ncbi:MAG: asparagine synthase (glutamine-hydrolyzing) [Pyrinomonadaceae bacterium]
MCGIVGIANQGGRAVSRTALERMNACIIHRGPDEDGFYVNENIGLAMRRLSIIDLAGGQQPIFNSDRTKAIVFNGEIYNFQDLRKDLEKQGHQFYTHCDTEVIIHLYERYGADCVQHLRGMFAFAIWDETANTLFIARDRVGKKPLLYSHQSNGDLIFGSEFRALLAHESVGRTIDFEAIHHYLSFLCVPAPLTAFRQIRKLEPAHWLLWKNGEIKTERYWLPDFSKKIKISQPEAEEETLRILREAVKLRLISEVPLGAFLSGGVDSSLVVALMAEQSAKPVKTFSIGFEEQDYSELKYAKTVANHVGAEHHEFIVRPNALEVLPTLVEHYGEPYADSSAIPTYYVARETRKHVTVALNGDGGDESFAGYERYMAMRLAERYRQLPRLLRESLIAKVIELIPTSELKRSRARDLKRFLSAASLPSVERYFRWSSAFSSDFKIELYSNEFKHQTASFETSRILGDWFARGNGIGIVDKTMFTDQQTYLPNDLLTKVDIASMAVSLEARSPFLDHKVIEFAASLPEKLKLNGTETKSLLKKAAARVVPREVLYRRKMGFGVPIGKWMRSEMQPFVRETLLGAKSLSRGFFNPLTVKKIVEQHTSGQKDHNQQLWTLLMLELWFQHFID